MLTVELDNAQNIAILEPNGELSQSDFVSAAAIIDPYIESNDGLNGILIAVASFPAWDSFAALIAHFKFVRDHHQKIPRVAIATDSAIGSMAEHGASHFIDAEIKHFPFKQLEPAKQWLGEAK